MTAAGRQCIHLREWKTKTWPIRMHTSDIETHSDSLNDPPQPTSVFDDGYCIYQTPTPSRINDFTPNSRTFPAMALDGHNLPSGNQHPYPFGY